MALDAEIAFVKTFDLRAFGERLEQLRLSRQTSEKLGMEKVSRTEFARALGAKEGRYFRYERGEIRPPIDLLSAIRDLTGVSLDWLISGEGQGELPRVTTTVGTRLRWARQLYFRTFEECAQRMELSGQSWDRYETDDAELPVSLARRFAHLCCVTLDYIYEGEISGLEPEVAAELVKRHPQLDGAPSARPRPQFAEGRLDWPRRSGG